ncbi:methyltransferase [Candidatus Micrarchaeota archaeon]|nr:methyltransferase [Candidatus Micrarchaeota archaeon]
MPTKEDVLDKIKTCDNVYPPREDTFLMLKAIDKLKNKIMGNEKIIDMCCGTGILGIYASQYVKSVTFVDIYKNAIECAIENANLFNTTGKFIQSDLFDKINRNVKFDIILFNPPYLPTDEDTKINGPFNINLDGGPDGRRVIDKFLEQAPQYLSEKGKILMLDSSLDNTEKTIDKLAMHGFKIEIILSQSFFFEKLNVILAER